MPPKQFNDLTKSLRSLIPKYNTNSQPPKLNFRFKLPEKNFHFNSRILSSAGQFQNIFRTLGSNLKFPAKTRSTEDYDAVVNKFVPEHSVIIAPKLPSRSKTVHLDYLDGDSSRSIISSFKINNEIRTMILKKHENEWHKAYDISVPGFESIHYRGTADLNGDGKRHLLIGLNSNNNEPTLYGFKIENNHLKELFKRKYSKLEVLDHTSKSRNFKKSQLAFWDKNDDGTYNIEIHHWNGTNLEKLEDHSAYYQRRVVPYYLQKVRVRPSQSAAWYGLADSLLKTGMKRDALKAVKAGISFDRNSEFSEKFSALKNEIYKK